MTRMSTPPAEPSTASMSDPFNTPLIKRLPPEILSEILVLVPSRGAQLVQRDLYPWRLAFVCKLWRDVVFSTPRLWASITVFLDPLRVSKIDIRGDSLVAAWQLCLERSGDYPLRIYIDASTNLTTLFVPRLLQSLMKHVTQWQNMIFNFPFDILLPFIQDPDLRFPQLRSLNLRGCLLDMTQPIIQPPQVQLLSHTPALSRARFQEFPYPPVMLNFPWAQLTELDLSMIAGGSSDLLKLLNNTPNISTLIFHKFHGIFETDGTPRPVKKQMLSLPRLQKLSWSTYMVDGSPFFENLIAPNLFEIDFRCDDEGCQQVQDSMRRFLRHSRCSVTHVQLDISSSTILASFLGMFPDAEQVTLLQAPGDVKLMRALTLDQSSPTTALCPKMKQLVLANMLTEDESHNALVEMAHSRLRCTSDLSEREGRGPVSLTSMQFIAYTYLDCQSVAAVYRFLVKTLPPELSQLVTYKETAGFIEEQFD